MVGGYAMAFHGYVRATGDIDLWIRCSDENAAKVWRVLQTFGAPLFDLNIEDLKTPGMVFQIGLVPSRIDVITQIDGVEFVDALKEHKTVEIENLQIPVIGKTQLLLIKNQPADPEQAQDIVNVNFHRKAARYGVYKLLQKLSGINLCSSPI